MSECCTDTSYTRRTSSNYSASDGTQTTCTSDDQSDDNTRYTVRLILMYSTKFENGCLRRSTIKQILIYYTLLCFTDTRRD